MPELDWLNHQSISNLCLKITLAYFKLLLLSEIVSHHSLLLLLAYDGFSRWRTLTFLKWNVFVKNEGNNSQYGNRLFNMTMDHARKHSKQTATTCEMGYFTAIFNTFCSLQTIFVFSFVPIKSESFFPRASSLPAHQSDALSNSIISKEACTLHESHKPLV